MSDDEMHETSCESGSQPMSEDNASLLIDPHELTSKKRITLPTRKIP